jgi:hypothetical protein
MWRNLLRMTHVCAYSLYCSTRNLHTFKWSYFCDSVDAIVKKNTPRSTWCILLLSWHPKINELLLLNSERNNLPPRSTSLWRREILRPVDHRVVALTRIRVHTRYYSNQSCFKCYFEMCARTAVLCLWKIYFVFETVCTQCCVDLLRLSINMDFLY